MNLLAGKVFLCYSRNGDAYGYQDKCTWHIKWNSTPLPAIVIVIAVQCVDCKTLLMRVALKGPTLLCSGINPHSGKTQVTSRESESQGFPFWEKRQKRPQLPWLRRMLILPALGVVLREGPWDASPSFHELKQNILTCTHTCMLTPSPTKSSWFQLKNIYIHIFFLQWLPPNLNVLDYTVQLAKL